MALQLITLKKSSQPNYNVIANTALFDDSLRYITADLYNKVRQTPELVSMLDTVITDHFMGEIDFFDTQGHMLGPVKLAQVQQFWEDNNVQGDAFYGQALDLFVDGSSFGWHANADNTFTAKQKELANDFIAKVKLRNPILATAMSEDAAMPRKIGYLAASTVTIKNDATSILYFTQNAAGQVTRYDADSIVHVRLMDFNGEVRGFSPLKALTKEVVMMYMLKDNILAKLGNGGSPDNIISLTNANGVSKARFDRLKTALESFSHLRKSHGNMPIDADVKVHPLGTSLKDMEYRELALFLISEFALALRMPTSRIPSLGSGHGGPSNKGELSGNSEDAYQTLINARRTTMENAWNKIFRPAGFTFRFRRDNLQDTIRETQASMQLAQYATAVQSFLSSDGKKLTDTAALQLLSGTKKSFTEDDVELAPIPTVDPTTGLPLGKSGPGIGGMQQPSNKVLSKSGQDVQANKEKTASNNNKNG